MGFLELNIMKNKTKVTIAHTLGDYLAEYLIAREIPSLSCEACTRKVIQVTIGEADELERLSDVWMSRRCSGDKYSDKNSISENEWNDYLKYRYILKEKYLPHTLRCNVPYIDFSDEEVNKKIKKALIHSLWGWDHCDWSLKEEDIIFENEIIYYGPNDEYNRVFSYVTLKLGLEALGSYTGNDWIEIKTPQKEIN